jgi:hypothetical protein
MGCVSFNLTQIASMDFDADSGVTRIEELKAVRMLTVCAVNIGPEASQNDV